MGAGRTRALLSVTYSSRKISTNFPNLLELSFLTVLALPKDSSKGVASRIYSGDGESQEGQPGHPATPQGVPTAGGPLLPPSLPPPAPCRHPWVPKFKVCIAVGLHEDAGERKDPMHMHALSSCCPSPMSPHSWGDVAEMPPRCSVPLNRPSPPMCRVSPPRYLYLPWSRWKREDKERAAEP